MRKRRTAIFLPVLLLAACGDEGGTGPEPIAEIEVAAPSDIIVVGRSMQFTVEAFSVAGDMVSPPSAAWTSDDASVAEVSATGVVTGVAVGEAVITARSEEREATLTVRVAPDSLALFASPPFEGEYDVWNAFDHDLPHWSGELGRILTWRGDDVPGLEGHDGYDWRVPEDTPILAVGDGVVDFAGGEVAWSCPLRGGALVSALYAVIAHTAADGERILTQYIHLNRIDVAAGDTVVAGQRIGLSGNTGCSTGPHLHFGVLRESYRRNPRVGSARVTDPNGWAGDRHDPWLLDDDGAASSYLWVPGSAPAFPFAATGTAVEPTDMHRLRVRPSAPPSGRS